tara:strand:+ start:628 stop:906 length:279 start_codon:yes stop_codon:yes gene_type:complete
MGKSHPGIFFCEEDRGKGPFKLRVSGTSNFVTEININYYSRFGGPSLEKVTTSFGWDNPKALLYPNLSKAIEAAAHVHRIEGFHISIEKEEL